MKISLLGQFGSGNFGNDGSLEAMLGYLRELKPDAEIHCICSNPAVIEARHRIGCISIRGSTTRATGLGPLSRVLASLPSRFWGLYSSILHFGGVDLLIIPGTGILDDFQETAFGWPFILFWWCLAARIRRTKIAFVSIGAGPINGTLSRYFLRSAAGMATYRSYRDDYSLAYMKSIGGSAPGDLRYPDIAFSLTDPPIQSGSADRSSPVVGIGIMHYRGWLRNQSDGQQIYGTYIERITSLIVRLMQDGFRVRLLMGDRADLRARDDVLSSVAQLVDDTSAGEIAVGSANSLAEIMEEITPVDIAVVSRYHNLVCALKLGRPTISLGYALKNDNLMRSFGQRAFCHHIETFDVDLVRDQVHMIMGKSEVLRRELESSNRHLQEQLSMQKAYLKSTLLA